MTATTFTPPAPAAPGASGALAPVPFSRIVRVELRKTVDTRAGFWMIVAMAVVAALAVALVLFTAEPGELGFEILFSVVSLPLMILLPILGIMTATSEWSQRTGLTTFTLEPRRGIVVAAKVLATLVLGVLVIAVSAVVAALANVLGVLFRDGAGSWAIPSALVVGLVAALLLTVLQGLGFGFSLLNTPVAIVTALLLPTVWTVAVSFAPVLRDAGVWLDLNRTLEPLLDGTMRSADWAHLATSTGLWVVLPLAFGTWRVLRKEIA